MRTLDCLLLSNVMGGGWNISPPNKKKDLTFTEKNVIFIYKSKGYYKLNVSEYLLR